MKFSVSTFLLFFAFTGAAPLVFGMWEELAWWHWCVLVCPSILAGFIGNE